MDKSHGREKDAACRHAFLPSAHSLKKKVTWAHYGKAVWQNYIKKEHRDVTTTPNLACPSRKGFAVQVICDISAEAGDRRRHSGCREGLQVKRPQRQRQ